MSGKGETGVVFQFPQAALENAVAARARRCKPHASVSDRPFCVLEPAGEAQSIGDSAPRPDAAGGGRTVHVGVERAVAGRRLSLAHVDAATGRVRAWRHNVRLYEFAARHVDDVAELLAGRRRPATNYARDYESQQDAGGDSASRSEQKRALQSDFGSAKRAKMVQQSAQRSVKEDAMESMVKSALTKVGRDADPAAAVPDEEDANAAGPSKESSASITMLQQVTSSLLPPWNEDAASPREIYSMDTFVSESAMHTLADDVRQFMAMTPKTAMDDELHVLPIASALQNVSKVYKAEAGKESNLKAATRLYYLGCLCKVLKYVNKEAKKRAQLKDADFNGLKVSDAARAVIAASFFPAAGGERRRAGAYAVNKTVKDTLLAHALCMAMLMSPSLSLDVPYWSSALGVADKQAKDVCRALGADVTTGRGAAGVKCTATLARSPAEARKLAQQHGGGRGRFGGRGGRGR